MLTPCELMELGRFAKSLGIEVDDRFEIKFKQGQPRVPAGSSRGGEFTSAGGIGGGMANLSGIPESSGAVGSVEREKGKVTIPKGYKAAGEAPSGSLGSGKWYMGKGFTFQDDKGNAITIERTGLGYLAGVNGKVIASGYFGNAQRAMDTAVTYLSQPKGL